MVQEAKKECWDRWVKEIFPSLSSQKVVQKDWKRAGQRHRTPKRRASSWSNLLYKYMRIAAVHKGSDGMARSADIEYKLPEEEKKKHQAYSQTDHVGSQGTCQGPRTEKTLPRHPRIEAEGMQTCPFSLGWGKIEILKRIGE